MKKYLLTAALCCMLFTAQAQIKTPQVSTKAKIEQVVGLTDITIDYTRPNIKGRTVFGELVPYGKTWRTGANENTIIKFDTDVKVGGKPLEKGSYALYTLPKVEQWEVIFYKDINNWGLPEQWDETKVAARITVKPEAVNRMVETFSLAVNNVTYDGADLEISWEKTLVSVKIEVPTNEITTKNIDAVLSGPKAADFYAAAEYYYQTNGDMNKALTWVDKSIEMNSNPPFWYYRLKSLIQNKKGDKAGAIASAKLSLAGAERANNADYIKMNNDSIREWSKK